MNIFIFVHTANFIFHKLKHQFGVFSQNLKVSGWSQTASPMSLNEHQRRQLLSRPRGEPGCSGQKFAASFIPKKTAEKT